MESKWKVSLTGLAQATLKWCNMQVTKYKGFTITVIGITHTVTKDGVYTGMAQSMAGAKRVTTAFIDGIAVNEPTESNILRKL